MEWNRVATGNTLSTMRELYLVKGTFIMPVIEQFSMDFRWIEAQPTVRPWHFPGTLTHRFDAQPIYDGVKELNIPCSQHTLDILTASPLFIQLPEPVMWRHHLFCGFLAAQHTVVNLDVIRQISDNFQGVDPGISSGSWVTRAWVFQQGIINSNKLYLPPITIP